MAGMVVCHTALSPRHDLTRGEADALVQPFYQRLKTHGIQNQDKGLAASAQPEGRPQVACLTCESFWLPRCSAWAGRLTAQARSSARGVGSDSAEFPGRKRVNVVGDARVSSSRPPLASAIDLAMARPMPCP